MKSAAPARGRRFSFRASPALAAARYTGLVREFHVEEDRVRIERHRIRYRTGLGQLAAVQRAATDIVELLRIGDRNGELVVVEQQVLAIQREPNVLVVLV